jgi:hypothetical protein
MKTLAQSVKYKRKSVNLTQEEFTLKAGVALTVVRKIEHVLRLIILIGHQLNLSMPK